MLSIQKQVVNSTLSSRLLMNSIKSIVSYGTLRNFASVHSIPLAGGIHFSDGVIDLPKEVGPVYSSRKEKCGIIALNNQRFKNSLTNKSYSQVYKSLIDYESNEHLGSIVIGSSCQHLFSTGSDYRSCFLNSNGKNFKDLFLGMKRKEYDVMNQIHISDIPMITLMDGEVAADGAALGFNARFPIITERTSLHFPQAKYGLFPDAGISKFLSSLGGYGLYLALTDAKIEGYDLLYLGLGRNFIEHSSLEILVDELSRNHSRDPSRIQSIIDTITIPIPPPSEEIIQHYNEISQLFNPCFTQDTSVLDLLTRLQQSETGQQIYNQLKNSTSQLQLIWKSIIDASKLSIHGTLKRDYLVLQNIFTKEEGKEFRNRIENRFALQQKDEITTTIQPEVIDKVNSLFEGQSPLSLEKMNTYDIPLFHGDTKENEKYFNRVTKEKYDWKRLEKEYQHKESSEEEMNMNMSERSFVHPVTKLVHPVPFEWEEDIVMKREQTRRRRQRQMEYESEIVLSSVPGTKYEQ